jgi:23S rRNA (uracil1939-C5)-methyltransferase
MPTRVAERGGAVSEFRYFMNGGTGAVTPDGLGFLARHTVNRALRTPAGPPGPTDAPCPNLSGPLQWVLPSTCVDPIAELRGLGLDDAALILRHLSPLTTEDRETLRAFAIKSNIRLFLQSGGPDSVELLAATSTDPLFFTLPSFNLVLQFSPLDFIQAHGKLNDLLVSSAIDWLNPKSHEVILDLFCGLGNFSLPIAQRAAQVIGIEGSSAMTERASSNAALNGITNTTFFACDLEQPIAQHSWSHQKYDAILLDPPRSGANNIIPALCEISPSRMVYVSCNPVTFARDAILLNSFGYNLSRVRVADMFPHTEHVETVGLFERT